MIKYNLMIMLIVGKNKNNKTSTFQFALIIVIIKRFFKNIKLFLPNFQFGRKNELFSVCLCHAAGAIFRIFTQE